MLGCDLPHFSSRIFQDRRRDSHGCSDLSPPAGTPLWPSPGAGRAQPVASEIQIQTQLVAAKCGVRSPLCVPVALCDAGFRVSRTRGAGLLGRVEVLPSPLRKTAELFSRQQRVRARFSTSSAALGIVCFTMAILAG